MTPSGYHWSAIGRGNDDGRGDAELLVRRDGFIAGRCDPSGGSNSSAWAPTMFVTSSGLASTYATLAACTAAVESQVTPE
jgi:hypothetical protein